MKFCDYIYKFNIVSLIIILIIAQVSITGTYSYALSPQTHISEAAALLYGNSPVAVDMPDLIRRFEEAYKDNPLKDQDAILKHALHTTHRVTFYRFKGTPQEIQKRIAQLRKNAFGKIGPLLATQKDGVVIPFIGDFYALEKAKKYTDGKADIVIRQMNDTAVEEQFGLVRMKDPDGEPYTMQWHTLRDVIGRLSIMPGRFGWLEIQDGQHEIPIRSPADLLLPVVTGARLGYRHTRLEVKGAGGPRLKQLYAVHSTEDKPEGQEYGELIHLMKTREIDPEPSQTINVTLIQVDDTKKNMSLEEFLELPGVFPDGYFQSFFSSAPGLEHIDQSRGVQEHQMKIRAREVTCPDDSFHFMELASNAAVFPHNEHGISFRMSLNEPRALRLIELLEDYHAVKKQGRDVSLTYLGSLKQQGKIFKDLERFLYRVGCNVRGMNASKLYMFPNGTAEQRTEDTDVGLAWMHANIFANVVISQAQGSVGNLMLAEEAIGNVFNNDSFDGRFADIAEYGYNVPATDEFAIAFTLHLMARVLDIFVEEGLLSSDDAHRPELLGAYLKGIGGLSEEAQYPGELTDFPSPDVFSLRRERKTEVRRGRGTIGERGEESLHYETVSLDEPIDLFYIDINGAQKQALEEILGDIQNSGQKSVLEQILVDGHNPENYCAVYSKPIQVLLTVYERFGKWKEDNEGVDIQSECSMLERMVNEEWIQYWPAGEPVEEHTAQLKELFIAILHALRDCAYMVDYHESMELPEAVAEFNRLVDVVSGVDYWFSQENFSCNHLSYSAECTERMHKFLGTWEQEFPDIFLDAQAKRNIVETLVLDRGVSRDKEWSVDDIRFCMRNNGGFKFNTFARPFSDTEEYVIVEVMGGNVFGLDSLSPYTGAYLNSGAVCMPLRTAQGSGRYTLFAIMPRAQYTQRKREIFQQSCDMPLLEQDVREVSTVLFGACIKEIENIFGLRSMEGMFMDKVFKNLFANTSAGPRFIAYRDMDREAWYHYAYLSKQVNRVHSFETEEQGHVLDMVVKHAREILQRYSKEQALQQAEEYARTPQFQKQVLFFVCPEALSGYLIWAGNAGLIRYEEEKAIVQFEVAIFDKDFPEDRIIGDLDLKLMYGVRVDQGQWEKMPQKWDGCSVQGLTVVGRRNGNYIIETSIEREQIEQRTKKPVHTADLAFFVTNQEKMSWGRNLVPLQNLGNDVHLAFHGPSGFCSRQHGHLLFRGGNVQCIRFEGDTAVVQFDLEFADTNMDGNRAVTDTGLQIQFKASENNSYWDGPDDKHCVPNLQVVGRRGSAYIVEGRLPRSIFPMLPQSSWASNTNVKIAFYAKASPDAGNEGLVPLQAYDHDLHLNYASCRSWSRSTGAIGKFEYIDIESIQDVPGTDNEVEIRATVTPLHTHVPEQIVIRGKRSSSDPKENLAKTGIEIIDGPIQSVIDKYPFSDVVIEHITFKNRDTTLREQDIGGIGAVYVRCREKQCLRILPKQYAADPVPRFHELAHIAEQVGRLDIDLIVRMITDEEILRNLYIDKLSAYGYTEQTAPHALRVHYALRALQRQYIEGDQEFTQVVKTSRIIDISTEERWDVGDNEEMLAVAL